MRNGFARLGLECLEARENPSNFWDDTYAGAILSGIGQGGLNLVNGVQDAVVGVANLPAMIYNNTAGNLGGGTIGYIPSPDWSKDVIVVNDPNHGLSKFLGGQGAVFLITVGASSYGQAGQLTHLTSQEAAAAINSQGVLNGSAGVFAVSRVYGSNAANGAATLVPTVSGQVPIAGQAAALFQPVAVVGPISAWTRVFAGAHYAPYTGINLLSGEATAVSVWAQWPVLVDAALGQLVIVTGEVGSGVIQP
jgi:hypothetical protein